MNSERDLLYSIQDVKAFLIENEKEQLLTSEEPQTLSLYLSQVSSDSKASMQMEESELQLIISPNLDLKLPANTRINFQSPNSYLIPRHEITSENNSVVRIEFPVESEKNGIRDERDTFEAILSQCNIIIEDATSPPPQYDPSTYKAGDIKNSSKQDPQGQIMIVDEENGQVIGSLGTNYQVIENTQLISGTNPVEITLPTNNSTSIYVAPVSETYLEMAMHPAYKNSSIVSKAALASRLIVTTSCQVTKTLQSQADSFTKKTKPNSKPLKFEPATQARIRKATKLTEDAALLSSLATGQVQKYAQNIGASMAKRSKSHTKSVGGLDQTSTHKPGIINKSLVAISTIADGLDQASRNLLTGTSSAVTTVVGHKYGPEAREISNSIGSGVRNCGLVYIDATGVTRRAILKSVVKGAVIGKLSDGSKLVVGSSGVYGENKEYYGKSDNSTIEPSTTIHNTNWKEKEAQEERMNAHYSMPPPPDVGSSHQDLLPRYTASPSVSR